MILNDQQQKIVASKEPRIVVSAAAGTGKTRVLTERIRHLLGVIKYPPSNILALTFTRYAANEMKERLDDVRKPEIMTFHAWAFRYLRKFNEHIDLRSDIDIITEIERDEIQKEIAKEMHVKLTGFDYREHIYNLESAPPDYQIVIKKYLALCKRYGLTDYDLLIVLFRELLENDMVRQYFKNRYKHILIDEFQDTNEYIWDIIQRLDPDNIFIVGDVDQCLYGFNGARPDIMTAISEKWTLYKLEGNYRCPADVVESADRMIANNSYRIERKMIAMARDKVGRIDVRESEDIDNDLTEIAGKETPVILCRTNADVHRAYQTLTHAGIACKKCDSSLRLKSPYFRFYLSCLRVLYNPYNEIAARAIFGGFFPHNLLAYKRSKIDANEKDRPVIEILAEEFPVLKRFITEKYDHAYNAVYDFLYKLPIIQMPVAYDREADLQLLADMVEEDPHITLGDFLANLSMRGVQDELRDTEQGDEVLIMTVHASKGLEFDNVVIYRADHFPIRRKNTDYEEERRIFYVAMTRAKERLTVLYPKGKMVNYVEEFQMTNDK